MVTALNKLPPLLSMYMSLRLIIYEQLLAALAKDHTAPSFPPLYSPDHLLYPSTPLFSYILLTSFSHSSFYTSIPSVLLLYPTIHLSLYYTPIPCCFYFIPPSIPVWS